MNEETGPFTDYAKKAQYTPAAAKAGWAISVVLTALLIVCCVLWMSASGKNRALQAQLDEANTSLTNALAKNHQGDDQMAALQARLAALQTEKEATAQAAKGLEAELRSNLESKDVTISRLQGKLTVNILDRVMFDSGEAVLQPAGEAVLRTVAGILAGHPEIKIHVIGHTDNVPIRSRFASNWELSTARALAAVHFLTEKAGVDPRRVGAVGYGEYRPLADNSTPEGRARNRRIAITILSDELAGADVAPANAVPSTNAAPSTVPMPVSPVVH